MRLQHLFLYSIFHRNATLFTAVEGSVQASTGAQAPPAMPAAAPMQPSTETLQDTNSRLASADTAVAVEQDQGVLENRLRVLEEQLSQLLRLHSQQQGNSN